MTKRGLVGAWCPSLGATGFRLLDRSGRGNHGTLTNMASTAWVTSGGKGALEFDGSNDFVLCTGPGPATTKRTVCAWFRTSTVLAANTYGSIVGWGAGTISQGFIIGFGNDANFGNNGFGVSQWGDAIGVTGFNDGNWHFGLVTNAGNLWRIYVDGLFRTSKTMSTTPTAKSIYFGRYEASPFGYFNGQFDDVRIYDSVPSDSEIWQMYFRGRGFGLLPEQPRQRAKAAAGFKPYWHRRETQLIGGGLK